MAEPGFTEDEQKAIDRPWRIWASTAVVTFTLVSAVLGFVILPSTEDTGLGPFAAICRAIGLPGFGGSETASAPGPSVAGSDMTWTPQSRTLVREGDAARGATVAAEICAACHGEQGIAVDPSFPNLAQQAPQAVFKQLRDYATARRAGGQAEVMMPIAAALDTQAMADVAAHFTSLPAADRVVAETAVPLRIETLARHGDPGRGLPACDACHGLRRSGPEETPTLLGQSVPYLEGQLTLFGSGERSNDIYGRMRAIARSLTPQEMHHLAVYYGGKPAPRYRSR